MGFNPFKLEKLTITSYADEDRTKDAQEFEVMYNPTTFSTKDEISLRTCQSIGSSGPPAQFQHISSNELKLDLVIDGTGVQDFGLIKLLGQGADSVTDQIKKFRKLCVELDGTSHEPRYLEISWGDGPIQDFKCRLKSVDTEYTSFDKNGAPLRAKLSTVFVEHLSAKERAKRDGKTSPDLTHSRVVKSGDTLPLLCREIYGSSEHYIRVAEVNELDNFRNLTPGQEIFFPPLEK